MYIWFITLKAQHEMLRHNFFEKLNMAHDWELNFFKGGISPVCDSSVDRNFFMFAKIK